MQLVIPNLQVEKTPKELPLHLEIPTINGSPLNHK